VPPELACLTDADCATTPYPRSLRTTVDCYCPTCPQPLAAAAAHDDEVAWQRLCAADWASRARCAAPMCTRPTAPRCVAGACTSAAR
jgi:hypothetical protein